ncbi:hypothetical protein KAR91_68390 [Candidatus Pacearchaeota archaeon]|nr:hypothetical protein [Candidatus Pacearchaeota archaeon]
MFGEKSDNSKVAEKITREKAFKIIEGWVDETRSRVYGEELIDLQNLLWVAVVDERLALDKDVKRNFTYVLEEPIEKKDCSGSLSIFKISPTILDKILESEDKKSTAEKTTSLILTFCKDSEKKDIPIGFITRIDPRDSIVIQAVITAFFF